MRKENSSDYLNAKRIKKIRNLFAINGWITKQNTFVAFCLTPLTALFYGIFGDVFYGFVRRDNRLRKLLNDWGSRTLTLSEMRFVITMLCDECSSELRPLKNRLILCEIAEQYLTESKNCFAAIFVLKRIKKSLIHSEWHKPTAQKLMELRQVAVGMIINGDLTKSEIINFFTAGVIDLGRLDASAKQKLVERYFSLAVKEKSFLADFITWSKELRNSELLEYDKNYFVTVIAKVRNELSKSADSSYGIELFKIFEHDLICAESAASLFRDLGYDQDSYKDYLINSEERKEFEDRFLTMRTMLYITLEDLVKKWSFDEFEIEMSFKEYFEVQESLQNQKRQGILNDEKNPYDCWDRFY